VVFELIKKVSVLAILALRVYKSDSAYIWNFKIIKKAGSTIASKVIYITPIIVIFAGLIFEKRTSNLE